MGSVPHPSPCRCLTLTLAWLCLQRNEAAVYPRPSHFGDGFHSVLLTFIALACVAGASIAAAAAFCLRQHAKQREKERLAALGPEGAADTTFEYQVGMRNAASAPLRVQRGGPWLRTGALPAVPRSCAASTWPPSRSLAVPRPLQHRQRRRE